MKVLGERGWERGAGREGLGGEVETENSVYCSLCSGLLSSAEQLHVVSCLAHVKRVIHSVVIHSVVFCRPPASASMACLHLASLLRGELGGGNPSRPAPWASSPLGLQPPASTLRRPVGSRWTVYNTSTWSSTSRGVAVLYSSLSQKQDQLFSTLDCSDKRSSQHVPEQNSNNSFFFLQSSSSLSE